MDFLALQKSSVYAVLSSLGKRMYTPQGVLMWGARAKAEVNKDPSTIDATVGIATNDDGSIAHLQHAEVFMGPAVTQAPKAGVFGYAPIPGLPSLRQKWRGMIVNLHPELKNHVLDPVVTNGITHGLSLIAQLFLEPGETIIYPEKSWENYRHTFENLHGLNIEQFHQFQNGKLNFEAIVEVCERVASKQKKVVLLLNFPHNQTGFTPGHEELVAAGKAIHELCKKHPEVPFVVVLDDAYETYVYDASGQKDSAYGEFFASLPNLTIVKLDGGSKRYFLYGSRVGFITVIANKIDGSAIADEEQVALSKDTTSKIGGIIRGDISQVNHHGQLMLDALMGDVEKIETERSKIFEMLQKRWKVLNEALQANIKKYGTEILNPDPCNSGFFCFINLNPKFSPSEFVEKLIAQERLVVFPAEKDHGLRVAFCSMPESQISEAIDKIYRVAHGF